MCRIKQSENLPVLNREKISRISHVKRKLILGVYSITHRNFVSRQKHSSCQV